MKVNIDQFNEEKSDNVCEVEVTRKDCWSLDYTLAQVIHPALVTFASGIQSTAYVENEDVPDELKTAEAEEDYDLLDKKWNYVLQEMIWGFGQIKNDLVDEPLTYEYSHEPVTKENEDGTITMVDHGLKHVPENVVPHKEYYERLTNSTRLFGKYYRNLWN